MSLNRHLLLNDFNIKSVIKNASFVMGGIFFTRLTKILSDIVLMFIDFYLMKCNLVFRLNKK